MNKDIEAFFHQKLGNKFSSKFGVGLTTNDPDAWKDFNSPFSIDITTVPECSYAPYLNHKNSISYQIAQNYKQKNGRPLLNFFPFKFVTLKWLLETKNPLNGTKGYKQTYYAGTTLGGSKWNKRYTHRWGTNYLQLGGVYQNFTGKEKWLPLGDLAFNIPDGKASNGATDIASNIGDEVNNIIVALVYNDPKYCYKLTQYADVVGQANNYGKNGGTYFNSVGQNDDCDDIDDSNPKDIWFYSPKEKVYNIDGSQYTFMATVYRYYYNDDGIWDRPNGSNFAGVALNSAYTTPYLKGGGYFWIGGDYGSNCDDNFTAILTSPFYTSWITDKHYGEVTHYRDFYSTDLIPNIVRLIACTNAPGYNIPTILKGSDFDCSIVGNQICIGDIDISGYKMNYLSSQGCIDYYNNTTTTQNHDPIYKNFCAGSSTDSSGNSVPIFKTDEFKSVCQCFLPQDQYSSFLDQSTAGLPTAEANVLKLMINDTPDCYFPACVISPLKTYEKLKNGASCRDNALQICTNKFDLSSGDIYDSSVVAKQQNNCVQNSSGGGGGAKIDCVMGPWSDCLNGQQRRSPITNPSGGGDPCPTDVLRSCGSGGVSKGVIIGAVAGVVVLVIIILLFVLRR